MWKDDLFKKLHNKYSDNYNLITRDIDNYSTKVKELEKHITTAEQFIEEMEKFFRGY